MKLILTLLLLVGTLGTGQAAEIVMPNEAQLGQPVLAQVMADDLWTLKYFPVIDADTYVVLYDAEGSPVIMFWSSVPGPRTFVLAVNAPEGAPLLSTKTLQYGGSEPLPTAGRVLEITAPPNSLDLSELQDFPYDVTLAQFYYDFAGVVHRADLTNKSAFRDAYMQAGKLCFQETGAGSPGLATAVDKTIQSAIGLDRGDLDSQAAEEVLLGIAWYFNGEK